MNTSGLPPQCPGLELGRLKTVLGVEEALEQRGPHGRLAPHSQDRIGRQLPVTITTVGKEQTTV